MSDEGAFAVLYNGGSLQGLCEYWFRSSHCVHVHGVCACACQDDLRVEDKNGHRREFDSEKYAPPIWEREQDTVHQPWGDVRRPDFPELGCFSGSMCHFQFYKCSFSSDRPPFISTASIKPQ